MGRRLFHNARQSLFLAGLTAIFVSSFLVWLPGPGAGLSLIGVELGEWIKFLGVGRGRDLFYLPPIALGLLLALWPATWPRNHTSGSHWRAWAVCLLAMGVALLAFPALAAIALEPRGEWLARLLLIVVVVVSAVAVALTGPRVAPARWAWLLMLVVAVVGAVAPTWQYLVVRPVVAGILRQPVGIGPGVWVNALGCALVAAVAVGEVALARVAAK